MLNVECLFAYLRKGSGNSRRGEYRRIKTETKSYDYRMTIVQRTLDQSVATIFDDLLSNYTKMGLILRHVEDSSAIR